MLSRCRKERCDQALATAINGAGISALPMVVILAVVGNEDSESLSLAGTCVVRTLGGLDV